MFGTMHKYWLRIPDESETHWYKNIHTTHINTHTHREIERETNINIADMV